MGKFVPLYYVKTGVGDLEAETLQLQNVWKAHKNATFLNWPQRLPIYSLLLPSNVKTTVFFFFGEPQGSEGLHAVDNKFSSSENFGS